MNKLRQTSALIGLTLILAVSAIAGTIHSPGVTDPPPPPTETTSSTTSVSTTVLLAIVSLIP